VVFTSDVRQNKDNDKCIGKASAVLRELHHYVTTNWELSNTAKLSVLKSVLVPIVTYGHESLENTKRMLYQVQAAEMGFSQRIHGATLRGTVRRISVKFAKAMSSHFSEQKT